MNIIFFKGNQVEYHEEAGSLALGAKSLEPAGGVAAFNSTMHLFVGEADGSWAQYCGLIHFTFDGEIFFTIPLRRALTGYAFWVIEAANALVLEGAQRHKRERDWGVEALTSVGGRPYRVKTRETVKRLLFTWDAARSSEIRAVEGHIEGALTDGRQLARLVYVDQGTGEFLLVIGFMVMDGWGSEEVARLGSMGFGLEVTGEELWGE